MEISNAFCIYKFDKTLIPIPKAKGVPDDQVRVASRHPTPDSNHIKFDWNDDSTWDAALQGVRSTVVCIRLQPATVDGVHVRQGPVRVHSNASGWIVRTAAPRRISKVPYAPCEF